VARSGEFRPSATRRVGGRLPLEDGDLADEIWSQTVTLDSLGTSRVGPTTLSG
jgi:hypothetical protein